MSGQASDQGRVYQVGQGTMIVNSTNPRPVAVVTSVPGLDAAAPEVFVGRDHEVQTLLHGLDPHAHSPNAMVVSAVAGMGGVGKSALARHAAGIAVDRHWFPGGAVWLDLQGYEPTRRIEIGQVFGPLLRALGVPSKEIPVNDSEQAAAYHRFLAQSQPVLLVLDNASATDQVRDLLPQQRVHRALVTTRDTLALPAAATFRLDVLDPDEAVALLDAALPNDARVTGNPAAAARVVELCGRLPLAVRIVAGLLTDDPDLTLSELAAELDASTRLDVLAHGDQAVAKAFDLSWQNLRTQHPSAATVLRLLVLNPGPDLSTDAAAALADMSPAAVRPLLRVLGQAHLVQQVRQRWRLHDLIRLHLARLPADDSVMEELAAARERLVDCYLRTLAAAAGHLRALRGGPVSDLFAGRNEALTWLDGERANLVATVERAASTGNHYVAFRLAAMLADFLQWRRHFTDWVTVAEHATRAALHVADWEIQGSALTILGNALWHGGRPAEAIAAHECAVVVLEKSGNLLGTSAAWTNLGSALLEVGRRDEAIAAHQQARECSRETGDLQQEGATANNLGHALHDVGRFAEAIDAFQYAIARYRVTGDRHKEAMALHNLGMVLREVGRVGESIDAYELALALVRETGDRYVEAGVLHGLGSALRVAGRSEEARQCWLEAMEAYTASDAPEEAARVRERLDELT